MGETVIVVVAIVAFVFLCVVSARAQVRDRELLHAERLAAIEKGLGLPPEAPLAGKPAAGSSNSLKTGLICVGLGLGTITALRFVAGGYWAWGVAIVGLGLAHLVYWFALGKAEWEEARRADRVAKEACAPPPAGRMTASDETSPE